MYDIKTRRKWINAHKLAELLLQLPADVAVECNQVGNLSICDTASHSIGMVDFNGEENEIFNSATSGAEGE